MGIKKLAVVGAGTMGHGIAQVAAQAGCQVTLIDISADALERALRGIRQSLDRLVTKGKLAAEVGREAWERIETARQLEGAANADLVVEAVVEKFEVKREVFSTLDRITRPEIVLASNTSSIAITRLAAATQRPAQVVGMHFMNPVPLMPLVEVIRGLETSAEVVETVEQVARMLGKTPVTVGDSPGFVSNRVLAPMINEAIYCLAEGVGTPEAIDQIMKLGMNHPMGPLALADLIGLDVCLDILRVLQEGFGDPKYRPCPLLVRMVEAGRLGRKTGRGFYEYPAAG